MNKRLLTLPGIIFLVIGIFLLLNSLQNITGFVTFESLNIKSSSFLGAAFVIVGILILSFSRTETSELEELIGVFNSRKSRNKEESYTLTDPELFFGRDGQLNLRKFKEEIAGLRKSSSGEELVQIIYDAYSHKLKEIAESKNEERAEMAEEFLRVLDPRYHRPIHKHEQEEINCSLTKEEREEIKTAFRQYNGKFDSKQRKIFRRYNLITEPGLEGHANIFYAGTDYHTSISSHKPSDSRVGIYAAHNIIDLIEKCRKHEAEQKKQKKN